MKKAGNKIQTKTVYKFDKIEIQSSYPITAWKVSFHEIFFVPYFLAFGLNTAEKTPYLDTFHVMNAMRSNLVTNNG